MHINTEAGVVHYTKMRPFEAISPYVPSLLHRFFCVLSKLLLSCLTIAETIWARQQMVL